VICRTDCYKLDENSISISCPTDLKQKYHLKGLLRIKYNGILKWGETRETENPIFSGPQEVLYVPVCQDYTSPY
ncbi:MAG: hypothetical protein ACFFD2_06575, partial [Promethearchaeota archaeon]